MKKFKKKPDNLAGLSNYNLKLKITSQRKRKN